MEKTKVGFAVCGSFCTFEQIIVQVDHLVNSGYEVHPVLSPATAQTDTRFGKAVDFAEKIEKLCGFPSIQTIAQAEPIGPKKLLDVVVVAPCTGNTLAKLAAGITDNCVTLAVKAHLRNARPVVIGVSTNDALAGAAKNIGALMNYKNVYFIPMRQDDPEQKPCSVVADFSLIAQTIEAARQGRQLQPVYFGLPPQ